MAESETGYLYADIPSELPAEITAILVRGDGLRIERIVSRGQASAPESWYDQEDDEWVLLIKGEAELRFAEDDRRIRLREGDYLNIPAYARHRVEWTQPNENTIWLAVFYRQPPRKQKLRNDEAAMKGGTGGV